MTGGGAPRSISRLASASRRSCTKVHSLAVLDAKRDIVSRMHPPRQTSVWRMLTKYNECAIFKHISNNVCHQFKKFFHKNWDNTNLLQVLYKGSHVSSWLLFFFAYNGCKWLEINFLYAIFKEGIQLYNGGENEYKLSWVWFSV